MDDYLTGMNVMNTESDMFPQRLSPETPDSDTKSVSYIDSYDCKGGCHQNSKIGVSGAPHVFQIFKL